ncbi:MAG: hypothetical protein ACTHQQ_13415 [Solirubrobacteraceae bacterium]
MAGVHRLLDRIVAAVEHVLDPPAEGLLIDDSNQLASITSPAITAEIADVTRSDRARSALPT